MRISLTAHAATSGAAERSSMSLLAALLSCDHQVVLVLPSQGPIVAMAEAADARTLLLCHTWCLNVELCNGSCGLGQPSASP